MAWRRHIRRRAPYHPFPGVDLGAGQGAPRRQDCLRCFPDDRHGIAAPFEALGGRRISLGAAPKRMHRYSRAATLRASLPLRHGGDSYSAPRLSPLRIKFCPRMRTTTSPGRPAGSSSSRPAALRLVKGGLRARLFGAAGHRRVVAQRWPLLARDDFPLQHRPQLIEHGGMAHHHARVGCACHCCVGRRVPADLPG